LNGRDRRFILLLRRLHKRLLGVWGGYIGVNSCVARFEFVCCIWVAFRGCGWGSSLFALIFLFPIVLFFYLLWYIMELYTIVYIAGMYKSSVEYVQMTVRS
jgi:hypothetical protein